MNRPFYGGGPSGIAYLGQGINEGVQNGIQNFLAISTLGREQRKLDLYERQQAMNAGYFHGYDTPDEVSATAIPNRAGGPVSATLASSKGPIGMGEYPPGEEMGPVGAAALASQALVLPQLPLPVQPMRPTQPQQAGATIPQNPDRLSVDELRSLAFDRGKQAR
jgi:hypothetical protein